MISTMLPNPLLSGSIDFQKAILGLNQIEGFKPVERFTDDSNVEWVLSKASSDSTKDIPDPKSIQFTDCWNHEFPGLKIKPYYVYVVEGIKLPRVETEQPTRILYQWFSDKPSPGFNPTMITPREWMKANVYAAPLTNARISKLKAICHITELAEPEKEQDKLLKVDELNVGCTSSGYKG